MTPEEAIAKAEQALSTSNYIAECTTNPGMQKIHNTRCSWLAIIVRLAKQAVQRVDQKQAHWINAYMKDEQHTVYKCSECGKEWPGSKTPFCPNCGKPMDQE